MPVLRLTRRRRSSLGLNLSQIKPGRYGLLSPSPRNVTFAPNITPGTYVESDGPTEEDVPEDTASPSAALFPPSENPALAPSRRRAPPGKRRSQGYIPRPPNAFMLFRANFVRLKHVPGSIETNHGSLSKIIGNCWRELDLEEKKVWENLAKKAKADHRERYPDYRFRPVHNKNKNKEKANARAKRVEKPVPLPCPAEERRCEEVAQLLLGGFKGEQLADAVRQLDMERSRPSTASPMPDFFSGGYPSGSQIHMPTPLYATKRRSSSVPPPSMMYNPISLPKVSFFGGSRVPSPVENISQRSFLGQRRASSAQPVASRLSRSWTFPLVMPHDNTTSLAPWQLQRDWSPLPEPDISLFEPTFVNAGGERAFSSASSSQGSSQGFFNYPDYSHSHGVPDLTLSISPLDTLPPQSSASAGPYSAISSASSYSASSYTSQHDLMSMRGLDVSANWSGPSSAFSGSPSPSEVSLPMPAASDAGVFAPQPQHALAYDGWAQAEPSQYTTPAQYAQDEHTFALDMQMCAPAQHAAMDMRMPAEGASFSAYEQGMYVEPAGLSQDYDFHDGAVHSY